MWRYLLLRGVGFLLTLLLVSFTVFALLSLVPGDPARIVAGPEATPEAYQAIRERLGLDRPWPARFGDWLWGTSRGDLGESLAYHRPVGELIWGGLSVTLPLAFLALALAVILALPLGVAAATRLGGWLDFATVGFAQLGTALPEFWLGILLIDLFAVGWGTLPAGGFPGWSGIGTLAHLILPALALGLPRAAYLARMTRAAVADVLSASYIGVARAKGLSEWRVLTRHALRSALIPILTTAGLTLGRLLAGALVVENVFYLPGLGRLALVAVGERDLPLLSAVALVVAGLMVTLSFLVDLAYGLLDPRIRYQ